MSKNILEVRHLNKSFKNRNNIINAINDVSFDIPEGSVVGLIGESGSGKTTVGRTIMNLHSADSGSIRLINNFVAEKKLSKKTKKFLYKNLQMIFQDPYSSLNTQKNILSIVAESLTAKKIDKEMLKDFLFRREDILFYSKNELKEFYLEKYWEYRLFANKIARDGFSTILNNLNDFKVDQTKSQTESFKVFKKIVFDVKEENNFEIISKLDDFITNAISFWRSKQAMIEETKFAFKDEADIAKMDKKIEALLDEIKQSSDSKNIESKIEELKKQIAEISENKKIATSIKKDGYKSSISNLKTQRKNVIAKKLESETNREYHFFAVQKEVIDFKISILKNALKIDTSLGPHDLLEQLDIKIQNKISNEYTIDKIKEILKIQEKEINYSNNKDITTSISLINKNEELKSLEDEYKKSLANDLQRNDLPGLKQKLINFKKEREILDKAFKKALLEYEKESSRKMKLLSERSAKTIASFHKDLKNLSKEVEALTKAKYKEILKVHKFEPSEFSSIKESRTKIKSDLAISFSLTRSLQDEIKENFKFLKNLEYLFDIKKPKLKFIFYRSLRKDLVKEEVFVALKKVGLNKSHAYRYPHEFSGGMRQRVGIARAIISKPKLIIADEPIAALDLSIQAQIVNLLLELKESEGLSLLFIAHDLSMVKHNSDSVLVMHLGRIVEYGETLKIFKNPIHPYTRNLMESIPTFTNLNRKFVDNKFDASYLQNYSTFIKPAYHKINDKHFVLATGEQFEEWKNIKSTRKR